jgi:N-acetylneuraminic acid mutarotase
MRVSATTESFDAIGLSWRESRRMKTPRYLHGAAFDAKGRLFVFGGSGAEPSVTQEDGESAESFRHRVEANAAKANTSLASVEMYDPATNTWSERAPLPTPRQAMGADLGADGRIYVVGGAPSYAHPRPMAVVEIYDPETDTWETGPSMNYARRGHAVVATPEGKLYAIGGFVGRRQRTLREQLAGDFVDPALGATVEVLDTRPGQ